MRRVEGRKRIGVGLVALTALILAALVAIGAGVLAAGAGSATTGAARSGGTPPATGTAARPSTGGPSGSGRPPSTQPDPKPSAAASAFRPGGGISLPTTSSTVQWVESQDAMTFDGEMRSYLVFRPGTVAAGSRLPVVVMLAGCCYSAQGEAGRADFRQVASPAILVYPQYLDGNWDAGACCGVAAADHVDDSGFITAVIDQVRQDQPGASPGPVYLAGYSNGGKLAMALACEEPQLFQAVAVFGATRTEGCTGPPPESVLIMAGTADPEDAVTGSPVVQNGYVEPTVDQLLGSYRAADGCSSTTATIAAGTATLTRWTACAGGHQVGLVLYQGLGHSWPAGSGTTPSGQQVMWDFFVDLGA
jgi:polyhydroxybutyrate depolymerase